MSKRYFLSFVEECIMNPRYQDCVAGRVEVYDRQGDSGYAIRELRFFTNQVKEFRKFRDKWDFKSVGGRELLMVAEKLETDFNEK